MKGFSAGKWGSSKYNYSEIWPERIHRKAVALFQQAGRILMEDAPFVPLYTLAEIYGVGRNVIWKAQPGETILAYDMKIR